MVTPISIHKVSIDNIAYEQPDLLAIEEPLEIRLGFGPIEERQQRSLTVTMRTPGHDEELATGYLFAEGIIRDTDDMVSCRHCVQDAAKQGNVLRIELNPNLVVDWALLERHTYRSSSCGVCGKTSIEAIQAACPTPIGDNSFWVGSDIIQALPARVMQVQRAFAFTGGVHAAALFDANGAVSLVREDVGRHNALDKLMGAALWKGQMPLTNSGVFLSGRIGFELVQKAWMAGVPILAAVGAPTSLAVELAKEAGITLIGFVRNERFNIYSGFDRVQIHGN